ncbi:probable apyrase 6 isoform X2 [Malania oleifera]|uniref:probable apyrase 6 isoform X2 n=1 Tax=Malania oleifera TaxID=397392 RepID=UPI0025AE575E|nr:probable apyrase 6 isoform X2 [Malania oleifera]
MDFSTLQSRASTAYIPPHRTQLHPRMHSFSSSLPPPPPTPKSPLHSREKWLILAASLFLLPFVFYFFSMARGVHQSSKFSAPKPKGFAVVVSGGAAAFQIRVFEFLVEGRVPFVDTWGSSSKVLKVRPGLTAFREDPSEAGSSVLGLIEFAKRRVPRSEWGSTRVQFMASGELEKLGFRVRDAILESCRQVLRASGFLFKDDWAAVMKGGEEGVYAWVAVNYALGNLGREPHETIGVVELGGASAQDAAWDSLHELQNSRGLMSFSSSTDRIVSNPCIPRGYELTSNSSDSELLISHPVGNFSACRQEVLSSLKKRQDTCLHPPCRIVSSFPVELQGQPVPPENFFYTSELFGLVPKASLSELETAGQHYCQDDWDKLKEQYHSIDDLDLSKYCFSSAYLVALLHDNLGISMDDKRVGFANGTSVPLDWTLGAFILQTMLEPLELEQGNLGQTDGIESITYFSLFAVLLIVALAAYFVLKLRKPQLKTIYDLEKGRYIVTRVPR